MQTDLPAEILQYLIDKLREKTGVDYVYASTRLDHLPAAVVQRAMSEAVEHFAGRVTDLATVSDLADAVHAAIRVGAKSE
jgi:hypothetical protein